MTGHITAKYIKMYFGIKFMFMGMNIYFNHSLNKNKIKIWNDRTYYKL